MKSFFIPIYRKRLYIYVGAQEWSAWCKAVERSGHKMSDSDKELPSNLGGRAWGSWVWINKITDLRTIFHELDHFVTMFVQYIGADGEEELRAYIVGFLYEKVLKWAQGSDYGHQARLQSVQQLRHSEQG